MSSKKSDLHEAALRWAAAGIPVFPCAPGTKVPFEGSTGFHEATTDTAQIDRWWYGTPEANIAFSPADVGWCVIDPDAERGKDGRTGLENWADLVAEHGAADTFTVRTARGGLHLYYEGELPPSQSKVGPHIDTRGVGSYALIPPSRITGHGSYVVERDVDLAEVPTWVLPRILAFQKDRAKASIAELDLPQNVARAKSLVDGYLKRGDVAIEGQMGDLRTFKLACEVLNMGVSEETAFNLILPWNDASDPPWAEDELKIKIENAANYSQNEAGAWGVSTPQEAFGSVLDSLIADSVTRGVERSPFYPYDDDEQDQFTEPKWTAPDILPDDSLVVLYGQPSTFKSFLALDLLLAMSSGLSDWGLEAGKQRDVVYVAGEGPRSIGRLRKPAWKIARGVEGKIPFHLVTAMPMAAMPETVDALIEEIKGRALQPSVVVIDTLARFMTGLNENDARDASVAIAALESIKRALKCSVMVIHHAGKGDTGLRGSSAILGGFDTTAEVVRPVKGISAVEVWIRKQKDADERKQPWTFEMKEIGQSIVAFPTTYAEHKMLTQAEDAFSAKRIGAALVSLSARGIENAVTTEVLATQLKPDDATETPEATQFAVMSLAKILRNLAKGALEPYCDGVGRDLRWMLP